MSGLRFHAAVVRHEASWATMLKKISSPSGSATARSIQNEDEQRLAFTYVFIICVSDLKGL
jgi:hypothetical protein